MAEINQSYIGVGKVHMRLAGTTGAFRHVGNCSVLNLKQKLDVKRQKDYTRLGGGTLKKVERLDAVDAEITLLSFNADNMALATAGAATPVAGAVVTDEVVKGYKGALLRLAHPPTSVQAVTNSAGITTYVAGTDFELSPGGLWIPLTSAIVDAADLKVDYTYPAYDRIEAATSTSKVMEVVFEGLNEAEGGSATVVDIWRMSVPAANELALIGDNMGELKFAAELLKDTSKGGGVSAYFRVQKV